MLAPDDAEPGSLAAAKVDFACDVRAEVERRKRGRGVLSYDDLLSRLAHALEDDRRPARQRMRRRWKVVLVDEFQDTDPVQWQVLDRAFSGHATLVLIGDPKQAIYAFRGGDIVTYLKAAETAVDPADPRDQLAQRRAARRRAAAAHARRGSSATRAITVHDGRGAAPGAAGSSVLRRPQPLRVRQLRAADFTTGRRRTPSASTCSATTSPRDLATDVARLLGSDATYEGRPSVPATSRR